MKKLNVPNKIINIQSKKRNDNIELSNVEGYFVENFYFTDIYNDTKLKKFIKSCESTIRSSEEYSNYIGFLNNTLQINRCAFMSNITKDKVAVEMHHYPFTLYDIVFLCVQKNIMENKSFNSITVSREVLKDHYENIIGLVPLSTTVHQLVHAGKIFININQMYGDVNGFMDKYYDYMPDEMVESYNDLIKFSNANVHYSTEDILKIIDDKK